ncbi:unnamed protein product [Albugo candida]|uniref:Tyrosinase copper-binding domain-containing protein n=1 Tax=Albugo candida TaxID=65357 RepID=A0A024FZ14_9STRA|nr:unnamed protein product [Albugo candida]|eukprot:CCI39751.1 unnamed protein product [Albugo candida]
MKIVLICFMTAFVLVYGQEKNDASVSSANNSSSSNQTEQAMSTPECGPRIRKSWDRLTSLEKETYLEAIAKSMDDGLYSQFVEVHTEELTASEAHQTCMFLYWHRLLLLGFENMLRSYGGVFSCITVPYWNYVDHNARFLNGLCDSMEDCALILRELGGSSRGDRRSIEINGTPIRGSNYRCISSHPLNHFCEDSLRDSSDCAGCVPRGPWSETPFPPTASISSLLRQLYETPTITAVAENLEQGLHNTIHNALSGAMAFLEAPSDPIFWSHHASLDLLHSIFYHCVVGDDTRFRADQIKMNDPHQFLECSRRMPLPSDRAIDQETLMAQSQPVMRSGGAIGLSPASVWDSNHPLYRFFANLPRQYLEISDIRNLGPLTYNYELVGLLQDMYARCIDLDLLTSSISGMERRLDEEMAVFSGPVLIEDVNGNQAFAENLWFPKVLEQTMTFFSSFQHPNETMDIGTNSVGEVLKEMEKMTCLFYQMCRGPVQDFTAEFRHNFANARMSPCTRVIADIEAGRDTMKVPNWKEIMLESLPCDTKAHKETTSG